MFKVYSFVQCNPEMTQAAFVEYFRTVHSPLCKKLLPGMRHHNGNFAVDAEAASGFEHAGFDAVIDQGFDSLEELRAAIGGTAFAIPERVASSHRFMDKSRTMLMVAETVDVALRNVGRPHVERRNSGTWREMVTATRVELYSQAISGRP